MASLSSLAHLLQHFQPCSFIQELLAELAKLAPKSSALPAARGPFKPKDAGADSKETQAHQDRAQHPSQLPWQAGGVSYDVTSEIQPAEEQSVSHGGHGNTQYEPASSYQGTTWVSETCSDLAGKAHDFWHGQVRLHAAWHVCMGKRIPGQVGTTV